MVDYKSLKSSARFWTPMYNEEALTHDDDDLHIQDVLPYVHSIFSEESQNSSKTLVDVATCNASALPIYKDSEFEERLPNAIPLGKDATGNVCYVTSMTYTILREQKLGNLADKYKGFISYVPMVLTGARGVFLHPGNAWQRDTVGMVTLHLFKDDTDAPDLNEMSALDALNQVLVSVAGGCSRWPDVQKFLVGYNILETLMKTIKASGITLDLPPEREYGKFDVYSDWRKMILALVYERDVEGLTSDIEHLTEMVDGWLLNLYDFSGAWGDELLRNVLITFIVRLYSDDLYGSFEYYMDLMYELLDEINDIELPQGLKNIILGYRHELENASERGWLEPLGFQAIRHNAGEFHTDVTVDEGGVASGIRYEKGLQPMIMPSLDFRFSVRMPGLRARLTIVGDEITLSSRKLFSLMKEYQGRVTAFSILGNGITRQYVPRVEVLQGSMVANVALSGILGPAAGLWVLSHIIHGDLSVSPDSLACYAKLLSVETGKLKLSAPLAPEIVSSIHAVTDGDKIYSVWHPNLIMKLELNKREWHATSVDEIESHDEVRSCIIVSNRPTASRKVGPRCSELREKS